MLTVSGKTALCKCIQTSILQHNYKYVQRKNRKRTEHSPHIVTCGVYRRPVHVPRPKITFSLDPGTSTLGQARTSWITDTGLLSLDGQLFTMRGHLLRLKVKVCATGKNISFSGSTSIAVYATTLLVYRLLKIRCQVGVPSHIFHKSYIYHIFHIFHIRLLTI